MKTMKTSAQLLTIASFALLANCQPKGLLGGAADSDEGESLSIQESKREALNLSDHLSAASYAKENRYVDGTSCMGDLKPGTKVAFSASYGIGGEAGQTWGVLTEKDGGLYFEQKNTTTLSQQGMQPPGLPFSKYNGVSLWEFRSYMKLICRIAFAQNAQGEHSEAAKRYSSISAAKVDMRAGTAGQSFNYSNLLELKLSNTNRAGVKSDFQVFFGEGSGVRTLEFREKGSPEGTFKLYIQPAV